MNDKQRVQQHDARVASKGDEIQGGKDEKRGEGCWKLGGNVCHPVPAVAYPPEMRQALNNYSFSLENDLSPSELFILLSERQKCDVSHYEVMSYL